MENLRVTYQMPEENWHENKNIWRIFFQHICTTHLVPLEAGHGGKVRALAGEVFVPGGGGGQQGGQQQSHGVDSVDSKYIDM